MRLFLLAIFLLNPLFAQAEQPVLSSYELKDPDAGTLKLVSKFFSLEDRKENSFEVIVPAEQSGLLLSLAPQAKLVDADTAATARARLRSFRENNLIAQDDYHSLAQVQSWVRQTAAAHPELAQVIQYGVSSEARPLLALRLNSGPAAKPVLMITAATHGDELITTEVLMRLIDTLIAAHGNDARLSQLVDRHDIYFVPVLNPDGFAIAGRYDGSSDPNRSYPYPGHESAKPTASIAGIIHLFEQIHPVGSIDFHAYGEMIMYPWAYTHDPIDPASRARFDALTSSMAATNHYVYGPISDVIYIAPGSSADYYFWKTKSISLGIEMGTDKIPSPADFPKYVQSQQESTWKFIESF